MENNRTNQSTPTPGHPEGCRCWMCSGRQGAWGCHGGHGHWLLRLIIIVAVISFVFALGVKLGELKGRFGYGYRHHGFYGGYPMMMQGGYYSGGYGGTMPWSGMMKAYQSSTPTQAK